MKILKVKTPAFTIIEVVLVLAIAGLIFLMVFIALPALQRNQRDTQRKNDMSRLIDAFERSRVNNKGRATYGFGVQNVLLRQNYLEANGDTWADPDGSKYEIIDSSGSWELPASSLERKDSSGNTIAYGYFGGFGYSGENIIQKDGRNYVAVRIKLEGGEVYCINN